ncbi:MAG: hypothetical protein K2N44_01185 [Lachnospiraceae bacterium]|nr:hypothetical protein [Lachnospiraceae bacterium]MDE7414928.1 hypothetical protein [Lachnospiraceae bacterium]
MKIGEAQKLYRAQRATLLEQRRKLIKKKEDLEMKSKLTLDGKEIYANEAATLELTIDAVTQRFDKNQEVLDRLAEEHALVWNAEVARQQNDAAQEYGEDMAKLMEVARRIGKGAKVPASDEKKLMDYSMEVYLAAKNLAMLNEKKKREKYKSLWEDEDENQKQEYDPQDKADNAETSVGLPDTSLVEGVDEILSDNGMDGSGAPIE